MHMRALHRVGSARVPSCQPCMSLFSLHLRWSGTLAIEVRLTCGRPQVIASGPGSSSDGWWTCIPRPRGSHDDSSSLEHGTRDAYTGSTHFIIHSCFSGSKSDRLRPQKDQAPSRFWPRPHILISFGVCLALGWLSYYPCTKMPSLVRLFAGALLFTSGLALPSPQAEVNVAATNTTEDGNQPASTQEQTLVQAPVAALGGDGGHAYHSPAWLPFGQGTRPQLSQSQTNGRSNLGTFQAPKLPWFIGGGPTPQGFPWGGRTAKNTNYYDDVPNTGITRRYDFTISAMTISPDGVEKQGLVINEAFPGPTIEVS